MNVDILAAGSCQPFNTRFYFFLLPAAAAAASCTYLLSAWASHNIHGYGQNDDHIFDT